MHKFFNFLLVITFLITACNAGTIEAQPEEQVAVQTAQYQTLLGKSLSDKEVVDFAASHNCTSVHQFQVCKDVGMVLWVDMNQVVETVYLYSGNEGTVKRYRGKLPFGLTFYDPMWLVQEKLGALDQDNQSQKTGLPDEAYSPDYVHYCAIYQELGLMVVYNSHIADPDAYIYAILLSE